MKAAVRLRAPDCRAAGGRRVRARQRLGPGCVSAPARRRRSTASPGAAQPRSSCSRVAASGACRRSFSTSRAWHQRGVGLRGWGGADGGLTSGEHGHDRPRRVGARHLRPALISSGGSCRSSSRSCTIRPSRPAGTGRGPQYRTAIFRPTSSRRVARAYVAQLSAPRCSARHRDADRAGKPFFPAERYHQDYLEHTPDELLHRVNDMPKLRDLESLFPTLYRSKPVLVGSE